MWIWNTFTSPIFSWYGSFWLISVPKTEIPSLWSTVWKQWRRHRGSKQVHGGPGKGLLFWREKKDRREMCYVHRLEGRSYWQVMVKFLFPGNPKYKETRTFWLSLVAWIECDVKHTMVSSLIERQRAGLTYWGFCPNTSSGGSVPDACLWQGPS